MRKSKYTLESCIADASRFTDLKSWRTQSSNFYKAAHRLGWLEECAQHLAPAIHHWTLDQCIKSAKGCSTKQEWRSTADGEKAYQAAWRNGWLAECTAHMDRPISGSLDIDWDALDYLFDEERNDIPKSTLSAGSHKEAWWICKADQSHLIFKDAKSITRGFKCPYCNEYEFDGKNSIASLEPMWLKEWDADANDDLDPSVITRKFPKPVNWICSAGHRWSESPKDRLEHGIGCRECNRIAAVNKANETRVAQRGSLLDSLPEIKTYWSDQNALAPSDYSPGSNQNVWLTKPSGDDIATTPKDLTRTPDSLYRVLGIITAGNPNPAPEDSVAARHPDLLLDWNSPQIDPHSTAEFSGIVVEWLCHDCGHPWSTTVASRSSGRGCPKCSKKRGQEIRVKNRIEEQGSAADHYPELISQWNSERNDGKDLADFTAKSGYQAWWICDYGHEWQAPISNRTGGSSCPFCAGRGSKMELRLLSELEYFFSEIIWQFKNELGELDLFLPRHNIGLEVDGFPWHQGKFDKDLDKSVRFRQSGIQVYRLRDDRLDGEMADAVKYNNGSSDSNLYDAFTQLLDRLPIAREKRNAYLSVGGFVNEARYKELLLQYPRPPAGRALSDVIDEHELGWDYQQNSPVTPDMVYAGSNTKYSFLCPKHGPYVSTPKSRKSGHSCKECGHEEAARKRRAPATHEESLATWLETSNFKPTDLSLDEAQGYSIKTKQSLRWTCPRGHVWSKPIHEMVQRPFCPECDTYEKSLATLAPYRADWWDLTANRLTAEQVKAGSGKRYMWKCPHCQHRWEDSPNRVTQKTGKKCPNCGFG